MAVRGGFQEMKKPKDSMGTLRRLVSYLGQFKYTIFLIVILCLASNVMALLGPSLAGKAINEAAAGVGKVNFTMIWYYVRLMALFYVSSALINIAINVIMVKVSKHVAGRMRKDVFDKLMKLSVGYFDMHQTGDIISRVSYDIEVIGTCIVTDVTTILTNVVTIIGSFIMMLTISPLLSLVVVITIPLSLLYTMKMRKIVQPRYKRRSRAYGAMNGLAEEMLSGHKTIQAYAYETMARDRFDVVNNEAAEAFYQADRIALTMGPVMNTINNVSLTFIAVLGSILFMTGNATLGQISSFVLYSRKFSGPINEISNTINEIFSAMAAAERVFTLLDETEEVRDIDNAVVLDDVKGHVEMQNVSFGYLPDKIVLHDLNLDAPSGRQIAIVGPTGAGKTTIINLLMRFYDVNSGQILVDEKEIRQYTRSSLRGAYAMVLQDTWVFHGTIFDNIAYGKEDATMEEVVEAAKAAHIHSFIMRLPDGYNTVISEDGGNISKGQKQLLTIARAMLYNARILILDEATSNVDTNTERRVQAAMKKLMAGKTCFTIAHRLSTIQNADCILVVEHGDVVEQGTHDELMNMKGSYYRLYSAQFN